MVDFVNIKVNRLSDSVVLQHLWNSIDDLCLSDIQPSKINLIERCKTVYEVETSEINKNLFLALKEGTISRNLKTDVFSRIELKEDRNNGDWYCFLCHKVSPDTRCRRCDTSFHKSCNLDLSDQFHCHTCRSIGQFLTDFQKFSSTTQLRIIRRVLYVNKIKWRSLNLIGYIQDDSRNDFFIFKIINAVEIEHKLSLGKYFSSDKNKENFLFDLLLMRHNCAIIYGNEHEFSKIITGYIKHLNLEIENIYCESCFLLFSKISSQKLNPSKKHELFYSVCSVQHPIMWGLVPPNIFWPFKLISEDNEKYYGIKFSKSIQFNRQKVESFSKEISLTWLSYNLQLCDRPSAELLKAFSLAQTYAQNLLEAQKMSNSNNVYSNVNPKTQRKLKEKSSLNKSCDKKVTTVKKRLGRPPKGRVGRPPRKIKIVQQLDKKTFLDNLSSTESSSDSIQNIKVKSLIPKKRKRIKDVFISDSEKPTVTKLSSRKCNNRRKKCCKTYKSLSSTESESNFDKNKYEDSDLSEHEEKVTMLISRSHRSKLPLASSQLSLSKHLHDNIRGISYHISSHKSKHRSEESYLSDDTIPQCISNKVDYSEDSGSQSETNEVLSNDDMRYKNTLTRRRSHSKFPSSSKYSAYSSSVSHSYNCTPDDFSKDLSKNMFQELAHNSLPSSGKDLPNNQLGTLETGLYCSSSSPVNFSPISNNQQTNMAQISMQSTPSSNYHMSCDETAYQSGSNLNMKIILKNRAFQMSSPLQLGINIDPKIRYKSQNYVPSLAQNRSEFSTANKNVIMTDYSESDY